jgi:hypothetical protein
MEQAKRERLEAKGWKVGTVAEFLGLTPEESALVEIGSDHQLARTSDRVC